MRSHPYIQPEFRNKLVIGAKGDAGIIPSDDCYPPDSWNKFCTLENVDYGFNYPPENNKSWFTMWQGDEFHDRAWSFVKGKFRFFTSWYVGHTCSRKGTIVRAWSNFHMKKYCDGCDKFVNEQRTCELHVQGSTHIERKFFAETVVGV